MQSIYVHGVASSGSAFIVASAPGYVFGVGHRKPDGFRLCASGRSTTSWAEILVTNQRRLQTTYDAAGLPARLLNDPHRASELEVAGITDQRAYTKLESQCGNDSAPYRP